MVTPLSCYTSPIICPYNQTNQFQGNKSLEVHMECFWDNRTNLTIFLFAKMFAKSKTQFWCFPAGGLSNSIWCWQYRRFNLWYCCHQIVWSALWVVHCQITYFLCRFYSVLESPSFDTVLMQLCKPKAHFQICITLMCSAIIELEYWKKINISIFSSDEDFHFPFAEQFSQSLNFRQNSPAVDWQTSRKKKTALKVLV